MRILHLTTQDNGGAGKAALRLHEALLLQGVDSHMLLQSKSTKLASTHHIASTPLQKLSCLLRRIYSRLPLLPYTNREKDIFSTTLFCKNRLLIRRIKELNPDIIHLHWVNSGFLNLQELTAFKKPIIWSLHDTNAYTGGCHVTHHQCTKFKTHCQKCPMLKSNSRFDISYFTFKQKSKLYPKLNLTINGLSSWIAHQTRESKLLQSTPITQLPNCIDTSTFKPLDKSLAKKILKIHSTKFLIGFGAINGTQLPRKGYQELKKALESLPHKEQYQLIIFGSSTGEPIAGIETQFLGHLHDDATLALAYNALDAFITPSLAENLSNTIMESLSCGTPVIAFDIGGNADLITHLENGYLASDIHGLQSGILWVRGHPNYAQLSQNARESIVKKFDYNPISKQYIQLYQGLLCSSKD